MLQLMLFLAFGRILKVCNKELLVISCFDIQFKNRVKTAVFLQRTMKEG